MLLGMIDELPGCGVAQEILEDASKRLIDPMFGMDDWQVSW